MPTRKTKGGGRDGRTLTTPRARSSCGRQRQRMRRDSAAAPTALGRSVQPTRRDEPRVRHDDAYELDFEDVFDDTFTVDSSRQRSVRP